MHFTAMQRAQFTAEAIVAGRAPAEGRYLSTSIQAGSGRGSENSREEAALRQKRNASLDPGNQTEDQPAERKPYTKPDVVHELALETRAGSPLGVPDPLEPFGLDPQE